MDTQLKSTIEPRSSADDARYHGTFSGQDASRLIRPARSLFDVAGSRSMTWAWTDETTPTDSHAESERVKPAPARPPAGA